MLSYLKIQGSPLDVGMQLGRFGAQAMHAFIEKSESWHHVMQWRGSASAQTMKRLTQENHPQIWQELQGLSQGLKLPLDDVFLWNCRGDLSPMSPDGCTTVQLPGTGYPTFAHNEDGDPLFAGHCAIAEVSVAGGMGFASFVYPGSLPGHTFAVTNAGLALTVNNLRAAHSQAGLPRMVLARAVLDMPDVPSALNYLQGASRSGGFHFTLAQAGSKVLTSVEFNHAVFSAIEIKKASLHANHMIHAGMVNQPQTITGSSGHRQLRGDSLIAQSAAVGATPDALTLLFDQSDIQFPIYRDDPHDSDNENTMASALLQVGSNVVEWQVHTAKSAEPVFKLMNGAQK
jgi:predicted choloylglycine hydrolase